MNQTVSFPGLGIEEIIIDRVAFTVFGQPVYWYGIIIATGMLVAMIYLNRRVRTFGLDKDRMYDVIIGAVAGGIVGARLYYVAFSWETYRGGSFWDLFKTREGGLAIYGGIIGGFLVGYLMCRWRKVKFLPMADLTVGGVILAQGIGRWGNFINIEAFGSNTSLPWGMAGPSITNYLLYHQQSLAAQGITVDPYMPVHPTFFYESLWCILGFLVIMLYTKRRRFDGELTLIYGAWYGLGRAFIEGLRTDSLMLGSVRVSQALAILLVIACLGLLVYIRLKMKRANDPDFLKLYVQTEESQAILAGDFYQKKSSEEAGNSLDEPVNSSEQLQPNEEPFNLENQPKAEQPKHPEDNSQTPAKQEPEGNMSDQPKDPVSAVSEKAEKKPETVDEILDSIRRQRKGAAEDGSKKD